jgi:hypothetical protein
MSHNGGETDAEDRQLTIPARASLPTNHRTVLPLSSRARDTTQLSLADEGRMAAIHQVLDSPELLLWLAVDNDEVCARPAPFQLLISPQISTSPPPAQATVFSPKKGPRWPLMHLPPANPAVSLSRQ